MNLTNRIIVDAQTTAIVGPEWSNIIVVMPTFAIEIQSFPNIGLANVLEGNIIQEYIFLFAIYMFHFTIYPSNNSHTL